MPQMANFVYNMYMHMIRSTHQHRQVKEKHEKNMFNLSALSENIVNAFR